MQSAIITLSNPRQSLNRFLYGSLLLLPIIYNFHRYVFQYGHSGFIQAGSGYEPVPLSWKLGKYLLVMGLLGAIYLNARYTSIVTRRQICVYSLVFVYLIINLTTGLMHDFVPDELEYQLYAVLLLPMSFIRKDDLVEIAHQLTDLLNVAQWLIIVSNLIVIFNYILFHRLPFHAYEGFIVRFGGLWDDPNGQSIFSTFLFGYSLFRRQYVATLLHTLNIILAFSFTSYVLLIVVILYWFLNHKNRYINLMLIAIGSLLIVIIIMAQWDALVTLYEVKQESVKQHTTFRGGLPTLPMLLPMMAHETWLLSSLYNYFPFSLILLIISLYIVYDSFFHKPKSIQRLFFIVFFFASLFLPFLYMFPINFFFFLFGIFYLKGIEF